MPRSSKSFLFPDVNVWLALSYEGHKHHSVAKLWFEELKADTLLYFCRFTQIGLLRLLTTEAVMGADEVMTLKRAWDAYDRWRSDSRVFFLEEPSNLDGAFRALTQQSSASPKLWSDAYLAAFASVAGLRFVTFDQAFRGKSQHLLILKPSH